MPEETQQMLTASTEIVTAYNNIPYGLINAESKGSTREILAEFAKIVQYYRIYKEGSKFIPEGSGADYLPADLRYKTTASLINKEVRFLFGETPDIIIEHKGDLDAANQSEKDMVTVMQDMITTILKKNKFDKILLQSAKDCFIGKRIAGVVNFSEDTGVTITFLSALNFIYETRVNNAEELSKFVSFVVIEDKINLAEKRVYKKKLEMVNGLCWLEESIYDGRGVLIEIVEEFQPTLFDRIPVSIFINDGLTGDNLGESEIDKLFNYESWYSKLSNADIDSERKSMNPIRYTVDMDSSSTVGLSSAAGSFWDLASDQNIDNPAPSVGMLTSSIEYSAALKTTLDRIKTSMYEVVDMPNITLESMMGSITSGKALKAIYWPLVVRCKEKMKMWAPQLEYLVDVIIQGSMLYPKTAERYTKDKITPIEYEIHIVNNYPLPEDEQEEKAIDISEVNAFTLSKKAYMKKWRNLTDQEANEELQQMALERELLDNSFIGMNEPDMTNTIDDKVVAK